MISRPTYAGWLVETGALSRAYGRGWVVESQSSEAPPTDVTADPGEGVGTGSGSGGEASGGSGGTNASAGAGEGLSTGSASGGEASATSSGSFTTDIMENNTGSGILVSTAVVWTWVKGTIGSAPTSLTHGSGTTGVDGRLTVTGLPTGAGFILVAAADGAVCLEYGTIS